MQDTLSFELSRLELDARIFWLIFKKFIQTFIVSFPKFEESENFFWLSALRTEKRP